MRPLIGITCSSDDDGGPVIRPRYVRAVHAAGGLPIALPFVTAREEADELVHGLHGLVLSGSEDLDPSLWGAALHPATRLMHPRRMASELHVTRAALDADLPVLGVCGGMQTLNVVAGGSLHQHIPDLGNGIGDHSDPTFAARHRVRSDAGSRLASLLGAAFDTNTEHHQAIDALGDGFVATAWCVDGLVEGIEAPRRRHAVAVQWHPERMLDEPAQAALFADLVAAAARA